jgi:hypothetical protein
MTDSEWQTDIAEIPIKGKDIEDFNILHVSAGTTSPAGGDAGHGGRTFVSIEDMGGTSWGVRITSHSGQSHSIGASLDLDLKSVEILLGGDAEAETIAEALEFAAATIRESLNASKTGRP